MHERVDGEIRVKEHFGLVVVREVESRIEHRWWFETTAKGRLVFIEEVVWYSTKAHPEMASGRHFRQRQQSFVPPRVRQKLMQEGYCSQDTENSIRYKDRGKEVPEDR